MMSRWLQSVAAVLAGCAPAWAQCHEPQTGSVLGVGDDIVLPMQALGFAFPFAGATYTDVHVTTNGFVHLSNGGVPQHSGALCCQGSASLLVAGSPKICPWWSDLDVVPGTGVVRFQALPGRAVVTWENVVEAGDLAPFSFQLVLAATGEIDFAYDVRCAVRTGGDFLVGWSPGNGASMPAASDFATAGFSPNDTCFELFATNGQAFDLAGSTLHLVPVGVGMAWSASPCAAAHTSFGSGCYADYASFYELFASAGANDLANSSLSMTFTGGGYTMNSLARGFVPPTPAATTLALGDDAQATVTFASPVPCLGGAATQLTICSNGFVSFGASGNGLGYAPDQQVLLQATHTGFWMWHDYDPTSLGSGQVQFDQSGGLATVTWPNVHSYGTTIGDTFQFQFELATGNVHFVWGALGAVGNGYLVGYSPGGPSVDPGSRDLSAALPGTFAVGSVDLLPLQLAAVQRPIAGAAVTYTTTRIPELAPTSGLFVALQVFSLGQLPAPGFDLGFLGAPGCTGWLPALDLSLALVGTSPSQSLVVQFPPTAPVGLTVFTQSLALFTPGALPNGQNPAGLLTSNGLAARIGAW